MNECPSTISANQILQQNAEDILTWLTNIISGNYPQPQEFNWLLLAEAAAFKARDYVDIKWAEVATTVYDYLAVNAAINQTNGKESLMISAMMLRTAMIAQLGVVSEHPVLDINIIINWFWNDLKISYTQVEQKLEIWQLGYTHALRSLPISQILELRQLKNKLKVIECLDRIDKCVLNPEIKVWLDLIERLP